VKGENGIYSIWGLLEKIAYKMYAYIKVKNKKWAFLMPIYVYLSIIRKFWIPAV